MTTKTGNNIAVKLTRECERRGSYLDKLIHDARVKKDLSLRDLARLLEVSPSYLCDIEKGLRIPSENLMIHLASELNLDFETLMCHSGRFGELADRWAQMRPDAIKLFRALALANPTDLQIENIIKIIDGQPIMSASVRDYILSDNQTERPLS